MKKVNLESQSLIIDAMLAIATKRRDEALKTIDETKKFTLGLLVFSGSYLSLLLTSSRFENLNWTPGLFASLSIVVSVYGIMPKSIKKISIDIADDVRDLEKGLKKDIYEYNLETAKFLNSAADQAEEELQKKKLEATMGASLIGIAVFSSYLSLYEVVPRVSNSLLKLF